MNVQAPARKVGSLMTRNLASKCRDFLEGRGYRLPSPGTSRLEDLVPFLARVLSQDTNEATLAEAARYLGMTGVAAETAIVPLAAVVARNPITPTADELRFNLNRDKPWRCETAALAAMEALKCISRHRAIDEMACLCRNRDPQVRFRGAKALQVIGGPAEQIIPILIELSRDGEVEIRRLVPLALWLYKGLDDGAVSTFVDLTSDRDVIVRVRADYLLAEKAGSYQRRYRDGVVDLAELLYKYPDDQTIYDVHDTVPMMGNDAARFVEGITDRLQSEPALTIPTLCATVVALRDVASHFPALTKMIRSSLQSLATPENKTAREVLSLWTLELRPKTL